MTERVRNTVAFYKVFKKHIIPRLKAAISIRGYFIANGWCTWAEAYEAVMAVAIDHGADRLDEDDRDTLRAWIGERLLIVAEHCELRKPAARPPS